MALLEIKWNPSRRELKQFAALWIGFFGLLGLMVLLRKSSWPAAAGCWIVAVAGLVGLFRPTFLRRAYVVWMCLALPIGWAMSHLLLLAIFFLVLTPIGLVMRLFGHDPLERRVDRLAKSYWTPHEPSSAPRATLSSIEDALAGMQDSKYPPVTRISLEEH